MVHDMEVCMKQFGFEFHSMEKMVPINIHRHLLNVYREQTVDVSSVRQWVVHFSNGEGGSPLLVQIFTSMVCRLLFITGENA